jgi:hypothetical protein
MAPLPVVSSLSQVNESPEKPASAELAWSQGDSDGIYIGIELNPDYIAMAERRIGDAMEER